jgi:ATP-binding cassette subfamily A (ABC1) protein 3
LSFALKTGECFSLLGVNGAGKSTTFKSLTKEIGNTTGFIQICGFDIEKDFAQARKLIGYCPQYNLIFENMTVYEHVYYYASVKGIPSYVKN